MNQIHSKPPRVAIISASWHTDIVDCATNAIIEAFHSEQASPEVKQFKVPGAYEIPLHAKVIAETGDYDAVVACALVVDGGIYRHDFVASAVIDGLMRVQLDTQVPVFSVVLTPHHFHDHADHRQFYTEHFIKKGTEAAHACLQTLSSLKSIRSDAD